jgi:hypothetical protein
MPETYYDVLGISRKVTKDQLACSYLAQALKWHPERHPNNPDAERRFTRVAEAFCVLFDPKSRFGYDRELKQNPGAAEPMGVRITIDNAHVVLRDMLADFVEHRLIAGANPEHTYTELVEHLNCPPELADSVVDAGVAKRKGRIRAAGMKMMWHGLGVFMLGALITAGSFAGTGGGAFVLWYGPIVIGGVQLSTALWCLKQGTEPPPPYSVRDL